MAPDSTLLARAVSEPSSSVPPEMRERGWLDGGPISVIVPCYNEERGLSEYLVRLGATLASAGVPHEIIVVDDGSTDGTAQAAEQAGVRVVRHAFNSGYGATLLTGFASARHDWIATIDGDGQFEPEEFLKILPDAPGIDMVVGRRSGRSFWGGPGFSLLRVCQLQLAAFVAGCPVPDPNSGLRLVRRRAIEESMPIVCRGFSFSTTITLSLLCDGRAVRFVPVRCSLRPAISTSKVRLFRDVLISLRMMFLVMAHFRPRRLAVPVVVSLVVLSLVGAGFARGTRAARAAPGIVAVPPRDR